MTLFEKLCSEYHFDIDGDCGIYKGLNVLMDFKEKISVWSTNGFHDFFVKNEDDVIIALCSIIKYINKIKL
jgi:hypothetical protein